MPANPTSDTGDESLEEGIDRLGATLRNIVLEDNVPNNATNMANNQQSVSIKCALECVPRFDGANLAVREFIRACKTARKLIPNFNEILFIQLIITKLTGNASVVFGSRDINTLEQLYNDLTLIFGDTKSVATLQAEMSVIKQLKDETVGNFACRVIELTTKLEERVKAENATEISDVLISYYKQTAVKSFIRGLKRELETRLSSANPTTIKEAIELARQAELETREIDQIHGYRVYSGNNFSTNARNVQPTNTCNYCGKNNHKEENCFKKKNDQRLQNPGNNSNGTNRQTNLPQNNGNFCKYCKNPGHVINDCRKRKFAETRRNAENNAQPSTSEN